MRTAGPDLAPELITAPAHATLSELTVREREVMELARKGLTAPEMADRLFVSVRTVESHLAGAYRKLGVRSRPEATERMEWLVRMLADGRPARSHRVSEP